MTESGTLLTLQLAQSRCSMHAKPDMRSVCTSEVLYGEYAQVIEAVGDWYRVRLVTDGYEGYVAASALALPKALATHRVIARSTLLFTRADIKSPIAHRIPYGALLSLSPIPASPFSRTACGYRVWSDHCLAIDGESSEPPLTLAQRVFLGAPYRWGGRSPDGIDCSGFVQALAASYAHAIPRDSGDQENYLHYEVAFADRQPGDLMYWPGHVGILVTPNELLHATAHYLSCVVEPLQDVVARAGQARSVKRLFQS